MVEIKNQENDTVKLPNNIRQVGTPGEKAKIYIEDYVMTYLNQITGEKPVTPKAALLLGEKVKKAEADVYFVSAAIAVVPIEWKEDTFKLSTEAWASLYDQVDQYFKNRHMLGWFLSRPGQAAAADSAIEKIHTDNFKDKGSLFYTMDPVDREDAFYLYQNGHLFRQHGYYIYYERNEAMQNYMIERRQENQGETEGVTGFQNRLFEKKTDHRIRKETVSHRQQKKRMRWIPQVAVLALILLVVGVKRNMTGAVWPVNQSHVLNGVQTTASDQPATEGRTETSGHLDIVESIVQQAEQTATSQTTSSETVQPEESLATESESGEEVMGKSYQSYTVKEGDTLLKISRAYYQDGSHVEAIRQLNQIKNPDYIYPGMVLKLP